jgi:beta-lactamase regulating signal transducer with metallopeptidase domain
MSVRIMMEHSAPLWFAAMARACWEGGIALGSAGLLCRLVPRLPPALRCWLWRLAYARLLIALVGLTPIALPLLTPAPAARSLAPVRVPSAPLPGGAFAASILCLWLAGVAVCAGRLAAEWIRSARLRRRGTPLTHGWLLARLNELCADAGGSLRRCPEVLRVSGPGAPALIGGARPAILIPEAVLQTCDPGELRLVLAHEIAHAKRADLVWDWIPAVAHLLFYFHPLVWLANQEYRLAQEMACDQVAAAGAAVDYCGVLVRLARRRTQRAPGVAWMSVTGVALRRRLATLLEDGSPSRAWSIAGSALVVAAALAALVPCRLVERSPAAHGPHAEEPPALRTAAAPRMLGRPPILAPPIIPPAAQAQVVDDPPQSVSAGAESARSTGPANETSPPPFQPPPAGHSAAPEVVYVRPPEPWPVLARAPAPAGSAFPRPAMPLPPPPAAQSARVAASADYSASVPPPQGTGAPGISEGYDPTSGEGNGVHAAPCPPPRSRLARDPASGAPGGLPGGFGFYGWGGFGGGFAPGAGGGRFAFGFWFSGCPPPGGGFAAGGR